MGSPAKLQYFPVVGKKESQMSNFISLSCPSCGSRLQITNQTEQFVCASCGNEYLVNRKGGIVSLEPVVEGIKRVQVGVDKTASELAISRLEKEIQKLKNQIANEKSKFDSAKFFQSSGGMAVLIFMIIGGSTGNVGAGFWVAVIAFILLNVGHGVVESNHDKENCEPLRMEIAKKRKEIARHKEIIAS